MSAPCLRCGGAPNRYDHECPRCGDTGEERFGAEWDVDAVDLRIPDELLERRIAAALASAGVRRLSATHDAQALARVLVRLPPEAVLGAVERWLGSVELARAVVAAAAAS